MIRKLCRDQKSLIKNEEFSVEGDGTETRSFCFIDDAIDATLLVNDDDSFKNRIFNVGNDVETSISDLLELLSKISGKAIKPKFKPKDHAGTKRRVPEISKAICWYAREEYWFAEALWQSRFPCPDSYTKLLNASCSVSKIRSIFDAPRRLNTLRTSMLMPNALRSPSCSRSRFAIVSMSVMFIIITVLKSTISWSMS